MKVLIEKLMGLKSQVEEMAKWERSGSLTMVNRDAHYQALAAVKDHVLKYVANMVNDMKNDEVKNVGVAGGEITIRKIMADMYSGKIRRGTDIIHEFDRITIPQLAGQMQSLLELYDPDTVAEDKSPNDLLMEQLKPLAEQTENGMVSQLLSIMAGQQPKDGNAEVPTEPERDLKTEIADIIAEANWVTDEARRRTQSVDPKAEILDLKERVEAMLARVGSIVGELAPTSQGNDKLHDTLHQFQQKHDLLVDRAQQELNILNDKVKELNEKLDDRQATGGSKTITIKIS